MPTNVVGCANPNKDSRGPWCAVDPRECPSYYAAYNAISKVVPGYNMTYYYMDYCNAVRKVTEAG